MKRKIMKIADTTYVVSLPLKWARKYGVKKGDEMDVEEKNNELIFRIKGEQALKKGSFEAFKYGPLIKRAFDAMYKSGYDEIEVSYQTQQEIHEIESALQNEAMTFEVVRQDKNSCIVKSIAEVNDKEFDALLRRTFLILKVMSNDLLTALQNLDFESIILIKNLEKTNNKLTHFLRRSLNKVGYKLPDKTNFVYVIVEQLEKIADEFKYLCDFLGDEKNRSLKLSKSCLELYIMMDKSFEIFSTLFFDFSEKKALEFAAIKKNIMDSGLEMLPTLPTKESIVVHYIINIERMIFDVLGPVFGVLL
ncbi:MAG: hypothetical protein AABW92_00770 [Nanoarchaeota archaeon]